MGGVRDVLGDDVWVPSKEEMGKTFPLFAWFVLVDHINPNEEVQSLSASSMSW